jgi:hypothetical protein
MTPVRAVAAKNTKDAAEGRSKESGKCPPPNHSSGWLTATAEFNRYYSSLSTRNLRFLIKAVRNDMVKVHFLLIPTEFPGEPIYKKAPKVREEEDKEQGKLALKGKTVVDEG